MKKSIGKLDEYYIWMEMSIPFFATKILGEFDIKAEFGGTEVGGEWDYKFYDPSKMFKSKKSKQRYDYLNMKAIDIINEMKECKEDKSFVEYCMPSTVMYSFEVCGSIYHWWDMIRNYKWNTRKEDFVLHNAYFELAKIGLKGMMAGCPKILGELIKLNFGDKDKFNETYGDKK